MGLQFSRGPLGAPLLLGRCVRATSAAIASASQPRARVPRGRGCAPLRRRPPPRGSAAASRRSGAEAPRSGKRSWNIGVSSRITALRICTIGISGSVLRELCANTEKASAVLAFASRMTELAIFALHQRVAATAKGLAVVRQRSSREQKAGGVVAFLCCAACVAECSTVLRWNISPRLCEATAGDDPAGLCPRPGSKSRWHGR